MITKKQAKILRDTWCALESDLSNIDWTNYGRRLLDLTLEESKAHDRFRGESIRRGLSIKQEAQLFAIKRVVDYLLGDTPPQASDYWQLQESCIAAYAIAVNPRFKDALSIWWNRCEGNAREIASWDYCDLIKE